jgi:hypothetical protein
MSALLTRIHMAAERGGAAAQDGVQHLEMEPGKPLATAVEKARPSCADDVGHLNGRPRHLLRIVAGVAFPGKRKRVERARGSVQALLRKVEIDGGLFQIAVSEQDLYSPQVRTGFKQMSGEAVTQGVRMDFLPNTGNIGRFSACLPDHLGENRMIGGVPAVAGKQPHSRFPAQTAIVLAQGFK